LLPSPGHARRYHHQLGTTATGPSRQLGLDWYARGADVEFWTNQQPPFLNKRAVNHAHTPLVDGERGMQWIADRFNGLPTTPNCRQF
jgi:hypothetical protein